MFFIICFYIFAVVNFSKYFIIYISFLIYIYFIFYILYYTWLLVSHVSYIFISCIFRGAFFINFDILYTDIWCMFYIQGCFLPASVSLGWLPTLPPSSPFFHQRSTSSSSASSLSSSSSSSLNSHHPYFHQYSHCHHLIKEGGQKYVVYILVFCQ